MIIYIDTYSLYIYIPYIICMYDIDFQSCASFPCIQLHCLPRLMCHELREFPVLESGAWGPKVPTWAMKP